MIPLLRYMPKPILHLVAVTEASAMLSYRRKGWKNDERKKETDRVVYVPVGHNNIVTPLQLETRLWGQNYLALV